MSTENLNIYILTIIPLIFFLMKYLDEHLFYKIEQKYCEKYKGDCKKCNCWSCKRKEYIDEYKNNRG